MIYHGVAYTSGSGLREAERESGSCWRSCGLIHGELAHQHQPAWPPSSLEFHKCLQWINNGCCFTFTFQILFTCVLCSVVTWTYIGKGTMGTFFQFKELNKATHETSPLSSLEWLCKNHCYNNSKFSLTLGLAPISKPWISRRRASKSHPPA